MKIFAQSALFLAAFFAFANTSIFAQHIPNDEYFIYQWNLNQDENTVLTDGMTGVIDADIDAPEAWVLTTGSPDVKVGVLDYHSLHESHPDLEFNNLDLNYNENGPLGGAHMIACAGLISANMDNEQGVSGIAPQCALAPIDIQYFYNNYSIGSFDLFIDELSNDPEMRVISISTGMNLFASADVLQSLQNASDNGMMVFMAAGNTSDYSATPSDPGNSINHLFDSVSSLMIVGASDKSDMQADYSYTGQELDIVAPSATELPFRDNSYNACNLPLQGEDTHFIPGEYANVWTLDIPNLGLNPNNCGDSNTMPQFGEELPSTGTNHLEYTGRFYGTSAATPQVAAVAALCFSANSCLMPDDVYSILNSTADKVNPGIYTYDSDGHSEQMGHGRVNAHQAVLAALAMGGFDFDIEIVQPFCGNSGTGTIQIHDNAGNLTAVEINGQTVTDFSGDIDVTIASPQDILVKVFQGDCSSTRQIWMDGAVNLFGDLSISEEDFGCYCGCPGLAEFTQDPGVTETLNIAWLDDQGVEISNSTIIEDLCEGEYTFTVNDGSCFVEESFAFSGNQSCFGDANCDGLVQVQDLSALLNTFGQYCDGCCQDMNNDGYVGGPDLSLFLGAFGDYCD